MAAKEKYKIGTWYDAPQRKGSRQHQRETSNTNEVAITKFFVSNLPGGCASSDLVKVLNGFGVIHNTYIARKFDKLGKRFGFVSFANVSDPVGLEKNMNDVWIGSYKLFIGLARFVDGERKNWKNDKCWTPVKTDRAPSDVGNNDIVMEPVVEAQKVVKGLEEGTSFRDKLLNVEPTLIKKPLEFVVNSEFQGGPSWTGRGAVGRVSDFKKLSKLRVWLDLIGYNKVGIKYNGGLWIMLVFESVSCMEGFVSLKDVWKVCFDNLEIWEGQLIPVERIAWLKIFGLPLCLYDKGIVEGIGALFGTVVHSSDFSDLENDLSYTMTGVLRDSSPRVNEVVKIVWKEKEYSVLVEEDSGDWAPDCLEDFSEEAIEVERQDEDKSEEMEVCVNKDLDSTHVEVNQGVMGINVEEPLVADSCGPSDVQLESGSLDNEGAAIKSSKKKTFRKKGRAQKSPSPVGLERRKKRRRDESDIFDIDRFIYTVNGEEARSLHDKVGQATREEYGNLDVNGLGDEVHPVEDVAHDMNIALEVKETLLMGRDLGVEEYDKYAESVEKVIQDEGFQLVNQ